MLSSSSSMAPGKPGSALWTKDALVADIVSKPLKPAAHPDASTRRQMATLREELIKDLVAKRDTVVHTLLEEESRARVAAAISAGLKGSDLAGSPFANGIHRDNFAPLTGVVGATPLIPSVPQSSSSARRVTTVPTTLPSGFDAELLLQHKQRPRRGFAVPKLTVETPAASSPTDGGSLPQSPRPAGARSTATSGGIQSPHSQHGITAPIAVTGGAAAAPGTSLPDELLQLMRQFRSAVDVLNAKSEPTSELQVLSLRAADVSRYVANFVVKREAERVALEEERLRGWMRPRIAGGEATSSTSDLPDTSSESPAWDPITTLLGRLADSQAGAKTTDPVEQQEQHQGLPSVPSNPRVKKAAVPPPQQHNLSASVRVPSVRHPSSAAVAAAPALSPDPQGLRTLCCAAMLSIHVVLDALVHLLQCDRAGLFLIDDTSHELASVALVGASAVTRPIRVPVAHGAAGVVFRTGVSINIPNTDKAPAGLFSRETQDRTGYFTRSLLCCPVRVTTPHGDSSDRVIGVVQVLNKLRPSATAGFSERDEDLVLKVGQVIGAILGSAGDDVSFTGLMAQEEGVRAQMVSHSFRHLAAANRGDAGTRTTTNACVDNVTLTEARSMHKQQLAQEARICGTASAETSEVIAKGLPDNVARLLRDLERRDSGALALIYRVPPTGLSNASQHQVNNSSSSAAVSTSHMSTLQTDSIVNLVAFLQRIEQSWRDTRDQCMRHEATIEKLTEARVRDQSIRVRLTRLCHEAGLITTVSDEKEGDEGGIHATLSPHQALLAEVDEFARDDEATFHARLQERQSTFVETFDTHQTNRDAKHRLRLAAAAASFEGEELRQKATVSARRLNDLDTLERAAMTPPRRLPLAPELERDKRNREFKERRERYVREELKGLVAKQRQELDAMLTKQKAETVALYQKLLSEDREAEALLESIFKEAGGLHPRRHQIVADVHHRLTARADSEE